MHVTRDRMVHVAIPARFLPKRTTEYRASQNIFPPRMSSRFGCSRMYLTMVGANHFQRARDDVVAVSLQQKNGPFDIGWRKRIVCIQTTNVAASCLTYTKIAVRPGPWPSPCISTRYGGAPILPLRSVTSGPTTAFYDDDFQILERLRDTEFTASATK